MRKPFLPWLVMILSVLCVAIGAIALSPAVSYAADDTIPKFQNYEKRKAAHAAEAEGAVHTYMDASNRVVDPDTGFVRNVAFQQVCNTGSFTERIARCVQHVITSAVERFLTSFSGTLQSYTMALIILAVTLFGTKLLAGMVENPGGEAIMLLMKIGGVLLFTGGATIGAPLFGGFLEHIFGIMESFAGYSTSYLDTNNGNLSSFLQGCGSTVTGDTVTIWAKIDCIMGRLFIGDPAYGLGVGLLWTLLAAVLWTSLLSPFILIVFGIVFGYLLLLIVRCLFLFLGCYATMGLLVSVSPLIIPLLLFKNTMSLFEGWLKLVMANILQPMILFGFMVFLFTVLDNLLFQDNAYSLTSILGSNWQELNWGAAIPEETASAQLEIYAEDTGTGPGDARYDAFAAQLAEPMSLSSIGNVTLVREPLIQIELNFANAAEGVPVVEQLADFAESTGNWVIDKVNRTLFPFVVTRIEGQGQSAQAIILQLLFFGIIAMILLFLMAKFANGIDVMVMRLAGLRDHKLRMIGATLPVERQIKGATSGAVSGAKTGSTAGVKGALIGAAVGAVTGAATADKDGKARVNLDIPDMKKRSGPSGGGGGASAGGGAAKGAGGAAAKGAGGAAAKQGGAAALKGLARLR